MKNYLVKAVVSGVIFLVPASIASAAVGQAFRNLDSIVSTMTGIVQLALPIVFSLAVLAFFWGIMMYVFSQSTDSKKEGKGIMLWSLIAIAIMASLFGIIALTQDTLGVSNNSGTFTVPKVQ